MVLARQIAFHGLFLVTTLTGCATRHSSPSLSPQDVEESSRLMLMGGEQHRAGNYKGAAQSYKQALALDGGNELLHVALSDVYVELEDYDHAVSHLQRAIQLDPDNGRAWVSLGTIYQTLGKKVESMRAFRRYLSIDPHGHYAEDVRLILNDLQRAP